MDDAGVPLLRNFDRVERNFRLIRCGRMEEMEGHDSGRPVDRSILTASSRQGTYLLMSLEPCGASGWTSKEADNSNGKDGPRNERKKPGNKICDAYADVGIKGQMQEVDVAGYGCDQGRESCRLNWRD